MDKYKITKVSDGGYVTEQDNPEYLTTLQLLNRMIEIFNQMQTDTEDKFNKINEDISSINSSISTLNGKFPVDFNNIKDGAVCSTKIGNGCVGNNHLQDNSVTESKIADNSISSFKLKENCVNNANIQDDTISLSKLSSTIRSNIMNGVVAGRELSYVFEIEKDSETFNVIREMRMKNLDNPIKLNYGILPEFNVEFDSYGGDCFMYIYESISGYYTGIMCIADKAGIGLYDNNSNEPIFGFLHNGEGEGSYNYLYFCTKTFTVKDTTKDGNIKLSNTYEFNIDRWNGTATLKINKLEENETYISGKITLSMTVGSDVTAQLSNLFNLIKTSENTLPNITATGVIFKNQYDAIGSCVFKVIDSTHYVLSFTNIAKTEIPSGSVLTANLSIVVPN